MTGDMPAGMPADLPTDWAVCPLVCCQTFERKKS
ncbi:hypothetical protein C8J31_102836 [Rhizobium sp. PP-CC-2G-626]|nr:hypothetical protein C8J31_102836 [Rhizobium sp. PP-CC-2G-626]